MASALRIIEICKICPPTELAAESSLPLTFFDVFWLKFHPAELIFFYELAANSFFSSVLPKLKQSLSLTLLHFLPFAGNLVWPSHSDKPFILYTPGDGISLSVAESNADFHGLCGDSTHEAPDLHHYVPELDSSDTRAAAMSFQITTFPNQGFCIGISCSHAVFDAKSLMMFLSAWAHICKHTGQDNGFSNLPPEFTPSFDWTVIQDHEGLDMLCLNLASQSGNSRSLKVQETTTDPNYVRATFKLSNEDINKIGRMTLSCSKTEKPKQFSRFVLIYSYVTTALAKAKRITEQSGNWVLLFTADVRGRSNTKIPSNYFGNCVIPIYLITEAESLAKEDGLNFVAEELTKLIEGLEEGALVGMKHKIQVLRGGKELTSMQRIGVAGSHRFDFFGIDFGWGESSKVEFASINSGTSISIAGTRDGRGVEVAVVLKKDDMETFSSLFFNDFLKPNITSHL